MAATYQHALEVAESLSPGDRLRLIRELTLTATSELLTQSGLSKPASILDLEGLGADLWQGIDAQEYVRQERDSWGG